MRGLQQQTLVTEWMPAAELIYFLELGDLIEFSRGSYYHWAVYVGVEDGVKTVVHFSTEAGDFEDLSTKTELRSKLLRGSSAHVRVDTFLTVAGNSDRVRINNYLDSKYAPFPPVIICDRAMRKLGELGYNLM
jgi:hypothetical protein